ncbi:hypothetical protein ABZ953_15935 [Streptomyces sp. NPDC046465]|uniref:hypothetical protein n=1 Tax=Streptomyces sp. NPDC046465 TaxID=3155810 RepID=UPI003411B9A8
MRHLPSELRAVRPPAGAAGRVVAELRATEASGLSAPGAVLSAGGSSRAEGWAAEAGPGS